MTEILVPEAIAKEFCTAEPQRQLVELGLGETQQVSVGGTHRQLELVSMLPERCSVNDAVVGVQLRLRLDGQELDLSCALYALPRLAAGLRIDCMASSAYLPDSNKGNVWGLSKDVILRLWDARGPLLEDRSRYPLAARWFATATQIANEPVFFSAPRNGSIYYHAPIDLGSVEHIVEVHATSEQLILSLGDCVMPGVSTHPPARYDRVWTIDRRGWLHVYSHLATVDPRLEIGRSVAPGTRIGVTGKEGTSGGWCHLHYQILAPMPGGTYGNEEAYAYLLEAYRHQHGPALIACARPHHRVRIAEPVTLSASADGPLPCRFVWTLPDGSRVEGAQAQWTPQQAGSFCALLEAIDESGARAQDSCQIAVHGDGQQPPSLHVAHHPSLGLRVDEAVTIAVRSFSSDAPGEVVDLGDGSAPIQVHSDGNREMLAPDGYATLQHRYRAPGVYQLRVRCQRADGQSAESVTFVHVEA